MDGQVSHFGDQLYDYDYILRNALKLLDQDKHARVRDKKLILDFLAHMKAKGNSIGSQAKYLNIPRRCAQLIRVTFKRTKRKDIEDLMSKLIDYEHVIKKNNGTVLKRGHYSPETMSDFKVTVKLFMKFVCTGNTDKKKPYPEEVDWIESRVKQSEEREPDFFTDADAVSMIEVATSLRDKAFISLWYEIGGRPGEILRLMVGCIEFDEKGALVHIRKGKTGARTLRVISSVAHLRAYMETHPFAHDPDAPIWLTTCPST